ncbi:MADS-box transcription factor [Trifolium medium]|uniref:MADS-box transcription factor n=1 Tax=Trifolium medium TaxID=97028 RepID=A0A392NRF0_9FABA|nr:MADS-box transcription factor [Trifolium medium]
MQFFEARRSANLLELNSQLTRINNTLDIEKRCSDELSYMLMMTQPQ